MLNRVMFLAIGNPPWSLPIFSSFAPTWSSAVRALDFFERFQIVPSAWLEWSKTKLDWADSGTDSALTHWFVLAVQQPPIKNYKSFILNPVVSSRFFFLFQKQKQCNENGGLISCVHFEKMQIDILLVKIKSMFIHYYIHYTKCFILCCKRYCTTWRVVCLLDV